MDSPDSRSQTAPADHGIQALIQLLRSEGIDNGRQEAQRLLEEAMAEIGQLREAAHIEADGLLAQARERIRIEQEASQGAIRLAFRDSVLRLKEDVLHQFGERLHRRVQAELADPALLRRLLLTLVQPAPQGGLNALSESDLEALARDGTARLMIDGMELRPVAGRRGLKIALADGHVELQLTDDALAELLLEQLLPRVRRHLDGGPVHDATAEPEAAASNEPGVMADDGESET